MGWCMGVCILMSPSRGSSQTSSLPSWPPTPHDFGINPPHSCSLRCPGLSGSFHLSTQLLQFRELPDVGQVEACDSIIAQVGPRGQPPTPPQSWASAHEAALAPLSSTPHFLLSAQEPSWISRVPTCSQTLPNLGPDCIHPAPGCPKMLGFWSHSF